MMRAKLRVNHIEQNKNDDGTVYSEDVTMAPVTTKGFDDNGHDEDNSFARYTPCGSVLLTIANPALHGKFAVGQLFYADFTPVPEEAAEPTA